MASTRPPLKKLKVSELAGVLLGNGVLVGYLIAGELTLFDLQLVMTLETVTLYLLAMVAMLVRRQLRFGEVAGWLAGLLFLVGWGWIWTLAAFVGHDEALWTRVFAAPGDPEHVLRQPQIMIPFLVTVAGVLLARSANDVMFGAMIPGFEMFAGSTLGMIVAVFAKEHLGLNGLVVAFAVVFMLCRVTLEVFMRKIPDHVFR